MQYKINLHAHTDYSDGDNNVYEIALVCKEMGFTAAVITDHVSKERTSCSNSIEKLHYQREDAAYAAERIGYPIIVGVEFAHETLGEVLIFGSEAIDEAMKYASVNDDILTSIRAKHSCGTILPHPGEDDLDLSLDTLRTLDGYEVYNKGKRYVDEKLPYLKAFSNSDAHRACNLYMGYNVLNVSIKSEEDLIAFLHGNDYNIDHHFDYKPHIIVKPLDDRIRSNHVKLFVNPFESIKYVDQLNGEYKVYPPKVLEIDFEEDEKLSDGFELYSTPDTCFKYELNEDGSYSATKKQMDD